MIEDIEKPPTRGGLLSRSLNYFIMVLPGSNALRLISTYFFLTVVLIVSSRKSFGIV